MPPEDQNTNNTPQKSDFVLECENLVNWARDESVKLIENTGIDLELKKVLVETIKNHFVTEVVVDDDCNLGSLKVSDLNNKLLAIYHTFRNRSVYEGRSWRNVGPEQKMLEEVSEIFRIAATKIEAERINRNLAEE